MKDLGAKAVAYGHPMPVMMVATYDERGGPLCSDRKQRFLSLSFSSLGCLY